MKGRGGRAEGGKRGEVKERRGAWEVHSREDHGEEVLWGMERGGLMRRSRSRRRAKRRTKSDGKKSHGSEIWCDSLGCGVTEYVITSLLKFPFEKIKLDAPVSWGTHSALARSCTLSVATGPAPKFCCRASRQHGSG